MRVGRRGAGQNVPLLGLYAFTVVALGGYATFGRHPQLLASVPGAAAFYPYTFQLFSVGHVLLAGAVLAARLVPAAGLRWLPAFGALYVLSLTSELAGTTVGLPFGEYAYSSLLGWSWFGKVPLVIPLSWFCMALPSYAFAVLALPDRTGRAPAGTADPGASPAPVVRRRWAARVAVGSLVLLAWDLALDPAMSYATRYWVWAGDGPYYGMPWLNLFGWYVTGVVLMGALAALRAERWVARIGAGWWAAYYGANLLLPFGMNVAAGLWIAVAATWLTLCLLAIWLVRDGTPAADVALAGAPLLTGAPSPPGRRNGAARARASRIAPYAGAAGARSDRGDA
jgi:uncharacterized membrane protein